MTQTNTKIADAPNGVDFVARAKEIAPIIAAAAPEIDANQRLTEGVLAALHKAEMFRMFVPRSLGGYELDPPTFAEVVETLAYSDASTAWIVSQCSICSMSVAYLPHETGKLIVGDDPNAILAWGAMPNGQARREGDGWRITGKWFFASGSRHATWMGGRCPLFTADGQPILDDKGEPAVRMFLFPKSDVTVNTSWDVIGLRGTGSDGYQVTDLFVPDDRQFDVNTKANQDGLVYRIVNRHLYGPGVAAIALGVSRAVLDSFRTVAKDEKKGLKNSAAIQSELGWAEARWRTARAGFYAAMREVWADIEAGGTETIDHEIIVRSAATLAIHEAKAVVDFAFHEGGAATILNSLPFERRVRDMHAILQHGQSKRNNMEAVGRYHLGMEPGAVL